MATLNESATQSISSTSDYCIDQSIVKRFERCKIDEAVSEDMPSNRNENNEDEDESKWTLYSASEHDTKRCKIDEAVSEDMPSNRNENNEDEDESKWTLYSASEHDTKFDPDQYLDGFYKTANEDFAMQVVLFFLPGIIYRMPSTVKTLLDLGAGPTVYVPIVFRNRAEHIYSSDYAEVNREAVRMWVEERCKFDWVHICEHIASIEPKKQSALEMQQQARKKLRAILKVDVHSDEVIQGVHYKVGDTPQPIPKLFQVVATIFCLEYASETFDDYRRAVRGAVSLIETGGYLVQGGVLNAKEYSFGRRRFKCHTLTKQQLLQSLKENGMETENGANFKLIIHDDIFVLISRKNQ
ncbi:putative methyltransferase B0303.2 [Toxocara canis]|uniref:Putative methyltransferase B0303.2 n=1 Tax=Toxocara canis TaxID=6265 RepID=A0A0B2UW27_TOXCA|nr:putative methyltransferase B0303.2 [Toxocara canis]